MNKKQLETPDNWTWTILSHSIHVNRQLTTSILEHNVKFKANVKPKANTTTTTTIAKLKGITTTTKITPTLFTWLSHKWCHYERTACQGQMEWSYWWYRWLGMYNIFTIICIESNWSHWDLVLTRTLYIAKFKIAFVSWKNMMDVQWMLSKLKRIWRWYSVKCHLNVLATKALNKLHGLFPKIEQVDSRMQGFWYESSLSI